MACTCIPIVAIRSADNMLGLSISVLVDVLYSSKDKTETKQAMQL